MNKVIKRDGLFELVPDERDMELDTARSSHGTDLEVLLKGNPDLSGFSNILIRLMRRIKALEGQIR